LGAVVTVQRVMAARERESARTLFRLFQARTLLERDPTEAVAWLNEVRITPGTRGMVRGLALAASTRGLASHVWRTHRNTVQVAVLSPDGTTIATGGRDGVVALRDLPTGREVRLEGHTRELTSVAFAPDGSRLASAS